MAVKCSHSPLAPLLLPPAVAAQVGIVDDAHPLPHAPGGIEVAEAR